MNSDNLENHMVLNTADAPWNQPDAPEETAEERKERERIEARDLRAATVADGFRQLADLIEENPAMALPYEGTDQPLLFMCHDRETFAATVKAFGKGAKADGGDTLDFIPDFDLPCKVFGFKRAICQTRTVKREVPAVVIPEKPATEEVVIPARTETVTEYVCEPAFMAVKA